jgi:hypothetical protein
MEQPGSTEPAVPPLRFSGFRLGPCAFALALVYNGRGTSRLRFFRQEVVFPARHLLIVSAPPAEVANE